MKKTKIICTMGPNTDDKEMVKKLILAGMDVARFNFSHGTHEEHKMRADHIKELRGELGVPVALLLDTKGPEIRTGCLQDGKKVFLEKGKEFTLCTEELIGDATRCSISYPELMEDVTEGDRILIDDGLIGLRVKKITDTEIRCVIENGGELGEKKGVNVPNVKVMLPDVTEKDWEDILFGIEQDFDFIAASFVRSATTLRLGIGFASTYIVPGSSASVEPSKANVTCPRFSRFLIAKSPTAVITNSSPSIIAFCPTFISPFIGRTSIE